MCPFRRSSCNADILNLWSIGKYGFGSHYEFAQCSGNSVCRAQFRTFLLSAIQQEKSRRCEKGRERKRESRADPKEIVMKREVESKSVVRGISTIKDELMRKVDGGSGR